MAKHLTASDLRRNVLRSCLREEGERVFGSAEGVKAQVSRLPAKEQNRFWGRVRVMAQERLGA